MGATGAGDRKQQCVVIARWARFTAWSTFAGFISTVFLGISWALNIMYRYHNSFVALDSFALVLDWFCNGIQSILLSGLVRNGDHIRLSMIKSVLAEHRHEMIRNRLCAVHGAVNGSAAVLASLVGDNSPQILIERACARFRSISWDTLVAHPDIMCSSGTLGHRLICTSCPNLACSLSVTRLFHTVGMTMRI